MFCLTTPTVTTCVNRKVGKTKAAFVFEYIDDDDIFIQRIDIRIDSGQQIMNHLPTLIRMPSIEGDRVFAFL